MTVTATAAPAGAAKVGGGPTLAGTATLFKFMLRRDRVRIPIWALAVTGITVGVASSWEELYPNPSELGQLAETMHTPAMVAMVGKSYAPLGQETFGSMMAQQMFSSTLIAVAVMSILMIARHTRTEEETGRSELVRASVVGRHASLTSALLLAVSANAFIGILLALGVGSLGVPSMDWAGSALYGAGHVAVGATFAAIAAITVQITEYSRGAAGMAMALLGLAYVIRAMGDVGDGTLSWLSPIGWAQATEVWVNDYWWPLGVAVVATVVFAAVAYYLSTQRDVGSGLRATRPGRAIARPSLRTPAALARRLHRGLAIGLFATMLMLGMSYGSILGDVESMLDDIPAFQDLMAGIEGTLTMAFVSMILTVMAMFCAIYPVLAMQRPRSEETSGRAEPVLSTAVSRSRWLSSHITIAAAGAVLMLFAAGFGLAAAGAAATEDGGLFGDILGSILTYTPAVWLTMSVSVALYGWAPRLQALTWLVVVYSFIVVYIGELLQLPDWMANLSPFGHVPQMPADDFNAVPLVIMTALAAGLVVLGLVGFRRRDLATVT